MAALYGSCASYRDRGRVLTRFFDLEGAPKDISERPFRTAFRRPDQFRFEFSNQIHPRGPWLRYVVWKSGTVVRSHWDVGPRDERLRSLSLALAGATGVSDGSAHTIPALLLPEVGGRKLTSLVGARLLGQEEIDGVECHHLTVRERRMSARMEAQRKDEMLRETGRAWTHVTKEPTHLWIAVETLLVRRIEEREVFDTFATTSVTDYHAELDVLLGEEDLAFEESR